MRADTPAKTKANIPPTKPKRPQQPHAKRSLPPPPPTTKLLRHLEAPRDARGLPAAAAARRPDRPARRAVRRRRAAAARRAARRRDVRGALHAARAAHRPRARRRRGHLQRQRQPPPAAQARRAPRADHLGDRQGGRRVPVREPAGLRRRAPLLRRLRVRRRQRQARGAGRAVWARGGRGAAAALLGGPLLGCEGWGQHCAAHTVCTEFLCSALSTSE